MRVVMLSKACTVAAYRRKLEELARLGVDLTLVVPPHWGNARLEPGHEEGYRLVVMAPALNGHHHWHWYPGFGRLLREVQPDLVHIDEEPYDFVTFHALRQAQGVGARTLFFTWQNLYRRFPPPFSFFERAVLRDVDAAIAGNADGGAVLRRKRYDGPLFFIPQFGIDPEEYSPAAEGASAVFHIGFASRLVPEKGALLLLEAVAGLRGAWHLSVRGSGPQRSTLARRIVELGLQDGVHCEEATPSALMPAFYRGLDVLVLPSHSTRRWVEQFGRVLTEAMACGVPVVGSDSGEIPNVIGEAGLIFPEGDVGALRERLQHLMDDRELRKRLGNLGRARTLACYTHERIATETEMAYRAIRGSSLSVASSVS